MEASAKLDPRFDVTILLTGDGGLRRGEIIGLDRVDVDFVAGRMSKDNRAGDTVFVAPDLVEATLARGFELHRSLPDAFQRASSYEGARAELEATNAFRDPEQADAEGVRLKLP